MTSIMFYKHRRKPSPLSGAGNLNLYVSQAVLPPMIHGSSAQIMPPEGHKAHRNHIAIRPEAYRSRFTRIVAPKDLGLFDKAVLEFLKKLPCEPLDLPNSDDATGFAFTVPAPGFNIRQTHLQRPSNIHEVAPWVVALPLQTMTRALHIAFPGTQCWDVTYVGGDNPDVPLWNTLVWRKVPPPPNPEKLWLQVGDPCEQCSVVFVVQPPWILTPQDFKSFMACSSLPPFDASNTDRNRPFTSAERLWAKLWDMCVRRRCHHWVLSSYSGWAFGAFTEGFTAGQILDFKTYDAKDPTIIECLVYHVASSMGLVESSKLPQYFETLDQIEWDMEIPEPSRDLMVDFPDSGSEWEGMNDEPGVSAGVSDACNLKLSAWGSEQFYNARAPALRSAGGRRRIPLHPFLPPTRAADVIKWQHRVSDEPPPYEREVSPAAPERAVSPAASETGQSTAGIFAGAFRSGSEVPESQVIEHDDARAFGGYLATVVEQGPDDDLAMY